MNDKSLFSFGANMLDFTSYSLKGRKDCSGCNTLGEILDTLFFMLTENKPFPPEVGTDTALQMRILVLQARTETLKLQNQTGAVFKHVAFPESDRDYNLLEVLDLYLKDLEAYLFSGEVPEDFPYHVFMLGFVIGNLEGRP